ncbi:MAG: hypothetical protein AAFN07_08690, partial [Pseudomonadota bacterium]
MNAMTSQPVVLQPLPENDAIRVCHYRSLDQIDASMLDRWRDLANDAVFANVYLTPEFLLPSLRHLTVDQPFLLAVSERKTASGWQSIALGVFQESKATRTVPYSHLRILRSPHGFLGGLLLRASCH